MAVKSFIQHDKGFCTEKNLTGVIYATVLQASALITARHFHPCLIFVGKALDTMTTLTYTYLLALLIMAILITLIVGVG